MSPQSQSIDPAEIAKFSAMAEAWWDENGDFKPLHALNPIRIHYIRQNVTQLLQAGQKLDNFTPFSGLKILDVGCGGGLLAEPMRRLGAEVSAIDGSEKNISIAQLHAVAQGLEIDYQAISAEALAQNGAQFDVVLNMEVIEHVADTQSFAQALTTLTKPGGLLLTATLNRTRKSWLLAIVGAEYLLRWLPRGTHDWKKFLTPAEIDALYAPHGLTTKSVDGVSFNPLTKKWSQSRDTAVNYMMVSQKSPKPF